MPKNAEVKSDREVKLLSSVQLFSTPWTVGYQAPPSMGLSRQEYWSGLPFPSLEQCSNYCTIALISHTNKVMFNILQARLQQYVNHELPEVQAGFRKGRGTRDQTAKICWIKEKATEFQKKHLCLLY